MEVEFVRLQQSGCIGYGHARCDLMESIPGATTQEHRIRRAVGPAYRRGHAHPLLRPIRFRETRAAFVLAACSAIGDGTISVADPAEPSGSSGHPADCEARRFGR